MKETSGRHQKKEKNKRKVTVMLERLKDLVWIKLTGCKNRRYGLFDKYEVVSEFGDY